MGGVGGGGGLSLAGVLLPSIPGIGGIGGGGADGGAGARFDGSAGAKFEGGGGGGAGGASDPVLDGFRIAGGGTGGFLPMGGVGFGFRRVSAETDCDNGEAGMKSFLKFAIAGGVDGAGMVGSLGAELIGTGGGRETGPVGSDGARFAGGLPTSPSE